MSRPAHIPVMRDRVLALLSPALTEPESVVIDATLGLGGHAESFLEAFPSIRLIGIDRDPRALDLTRQRLEPFASRITLVHAVYDEIPAVLEDLGVPRVQGILFDLGVSSMQLDEADRGFAYAQEAPLDMRMDPTADIPTAADILNTYPAGELVRILRVYGEERYAQRIVERVVAQRQRQPFDSSSRLVDLIREAIPAAARRTGGNPAKRTFQALRIEVNGELQVLERAIPAAVSALALGGRIAVLSYHSLEDRIVKAELVREARSTAPEGLPVIPESAKPRLRLLTRGAEQPCDAERLGNPRSASARLRAAERIREAA